ncbi:MAG: hypothetical protein QW614_01930 [Candidatus Caldarchaeum sp.]|uniref:Uncharacterized protein n=1 Tax=Caldiarchaeum subterraneum TaxID=311458 RepID=A0A7C5QE56_CALS0
MVSCQVCGESVPYVLLRMDIPRCLRGHELGVWVHCNNQSEKHVYLKIDEGGCPYCGDKSYTRMSRGLRVKCLHTGPSGPCIAPYYSWFEDGPPCHMNHLSKIMLVETKA